MKLNQETSLNGEIYNMTQQTATTRLTAVEWLYKWHNDNFEASTKEALQAFEQAKEIENEQQKITEDTSDGYHTFKELYEFRKMYNAALFNEWTKQKKHTVHKSWRHADGELCFGGGWFIVVALLPEGQISNHYEAKDWDLFNVDIQDQALFEFDGHTSQDVLKRLKNI